MTATVLQLARLRELAAVLGDLDLGYDEILNAALRVLDAFDIEVPEETPAAD